MFFSFEYCEWRHACHDKVVFDQSESHNLTSAAVINFDCWLDHAAFISDKLMLVILLQKPKKI